MDYAIMDMGFAELRCYLAKQTVDFGRYLLYSAREDMSHEIRLFCEQSS